MRRRIRRVYVAGALMMATIGLFLIAMASPVVSSTADFSIYNSGWNGTSDLAVATYESGRFAPSFLVRSTETDMTIVHMTLEEIALNPQTDALMILGPSKPFSSADGAIVGDFVRNGGVLILADDFGTGNGLLGLMGASTRFSGKLLMDLSFDKRPEFSVCFNFADDPLTSGVTKLLLNHPSSLIVSSPGVVVAAESSVASWLDSDGDSTRDLGEPKGPFPVIARESLGDGEIIMLSDPSLLINGMIYQLDNYLFVQNLIGVACDLRTSVFFDESHRDYFDPIAVTTKITVDISLADKLHVLLIAFVLLVWVSTDVIDRAVLRLASLIRGFVRRLMRLFGRKPVEPEVGDQKSSDEMVAEIWERHPEWKLGLIRYTVSESARHRRHIEEAGHETAHSDAVAGQQSD